MNQEHCPHEKVEERICNSGPDNMDTMLICFQCGEEVRLEITEEPSGEVQFNYYTA